MEPQEIQDIQEIVAIENDNIHLNNREVVLSNIIIKKQNLRKLIC